MDICVFCTNRAGCWKFKVKLISEGFLLINLSVSMRSNSTV